ncbi:MAG: hypothetical protein WCV81_05765 [Microgenomates group bacterium]|jgi:predicted transcriptional regulator
MKKHLAIMNKTTVEAILTGVKTIETRFSQHKIAPFGVISVGDLVYIKPPGEEIIGQFRVKKVFSFEGLTEGDLEKIFADYGSKISTGNTQEDEKYFSDKKKSTYGTLIFIGDSERFITSPIKIKKSDQRGWVVLD